MQYNLCSWFMAFIGAKRTLYSMAMNFRRKNLWVNTTSLKPFRCRLRRWCCRHRRRFITLCFLLLLCGKWHCFLISKIQKLHCINWLMHISLVNKILCKHCNRRQCNNEYRNLEIRRSHCVCVRLLYLHLRIFNHLPTTFNCASVQHLNLL